MSPGKPKPAQHGQTLRPPGELAEPTPPSAGEIQATYDLYATIKKGTASVDSLKLLIPGFEILEELGRGAFGVVYRARDEKLDRQVAIKVSLLDDPNMREQYIKEAKSAAKLDYPGIVPVYQVGALAGGQPFVVQRLIDGSTLRKILNDQGSLSLHQACWLMIEIARAVAQAHAVGMIHRDLKPDNILIDSAGKPWVADFGLAILEEDQQGRRGEKAGTPLYMSPEQLQGRVEWLDGRADIYAMGVMLYEMLVGRVPFDAQTLAELEEQVLHRDPKPISQRSPNIPAVMDIIFQNCCAKLVNDRYANAFELVADLQSVTEEYPEAESALAGPHGKSGLGLASRKSTLQSISTRRKTLRSTIRDGKPARSLTQSILFGAGNSRWEFAVRAAIVAAILVLLCIPARETFLKLASGWSGAVPEVDKGAQSLPTSAPQTDPIPPAVDTTPLPAVKRPFIVSQSGEGTHATIREAVAAAEENEEIKIFPGTYAEPLVFERSVSLVGEGDREEIVITGKNAAAVTLQGPVSVQLSNLTLQVSKASGQEFNTVNIDEGSLSLSECHITSFSYDCIKAKPGTSLKATNCSFRSSAHPAIYASESRSLELVNCDFDVTSQSGEGEGKLMAVQAVNSRGLIRGCTFSGSGTGIGIHWRGDKGAVSIEDAKFESCKWAIYLQDCADARVSGSSTSIAACDNGILVERSTAMIERVAINGLGTKVGIRVEDDDESSAEPRVQIRDCALSGCEVSLAIKSAHVTAQDLRSINSVAAGIQLEQKSRLVLSGSRISQSEAIGILIDDSFASLTNCTLEGNKNFGIAVDSVADALHCQGCNFSDSTSGLWIGSGSAKLSGGEFRSNMAGLVIATREQLEQETRSDRPQAPIFVDLDGVTIRDNTTVGMLVKTPCSYRIHGGMFVDKQNDDAPQIDSDLRSEQSGEMTHVTSAKEQ